MDPQENEPPADERAAAERQAAADFKKLRDVLLGPERESIARLSQRVVDDEVRAEELTASVERLAKQVDEQKLEAVALADVLPEAIRRRAAKDESLSAALAPTIEASIEKSVRRNPQPLTDAIFPVIGPAIRKSIRSSLSGMMDSLNQALENSLSVKGIRWRMEARRSGRSFAEVVLLNSIVYRVEQLFLIHLDSGVLLEQVVRPTVQARDADLVSSMLSAIQDFVRDSFSEDGEGGDLTHIEAFDRRIEIVRGPQAVLAAVVAGVPPATYREALAGTLEKIHLEFTDEFASFDGDTIPFEAAEPELETCLTEKVRSSEKKDKKSGSSLMLPAVVAIVAVLCVFWFVRSMNERRQWTDMLAALESELGVTVLTQDPEERRVTGLRDPLARSEAEILESLGVDAAEVEWHWEVFESGAEEFVLQRVRERLAPPETVLLGLSGGVLTLSGQASHRWIQSAVARAHALAGVHSLDRSGLLDTDLADLEAARARLDGSFIHFPEGFAFLAEGSSMEQRVLGDSAELDAAAGACGALVRLELIGITSIDDSGVADAELARERAEWLEGAFLELQLTAVFVKVLRTETAAAGGAGAGSGVRLRVTVLQDEQ